METETEYFRRRAAEELCAAARAGSPEARSLHRILAERYAIVAQQEANRPDSGEIDVRAFG